jgi:hypothetical protein
VPVTDSERGRETMNAKRLTIECTEQDGSTYTTNGALLPDGRVITYGTGVDGRDSLWAALGDYEANGLAEAGEPVVYDETIEVDVDAVIDADRDNREYTTSLLTDSDR